MNIMCCSKPAVGDQRRCSRWFGGLRRVDYDMFQLSRGRKAAMVVETEAYALRKHPADVDKGVQWSGEAGHHG